MLCALKRYKGITEFITLARRLPQYTFHLVVSDTRGHIDAFLRENNIMPPANLEIFDNPPDVIPFYREASLVVNLTDRTQAIETFGLTAIEAMAAALPVIVPTVGGIAGLVEEGENGYRIDVRQLDRIEHRIVAILSDEGLYEELSRNARRRSGEFAPSRTGEKLSAIFR